MEVDKNIVVDEKVMKKRELSKKYYEQEKVEERDKLIKRWKEAFPGRKIPEFQMSKGQSVEKFKKALILEITGGEDVYEYLIDMTIRLREIDP